MSETLQSGSRPAPPMRVGDSDRDAVVERLQAAFTQGRLTPAELDQRLHAALSARTFADLTGLTADLPPVATAPAAAPWPAARPLERRRCSVGPAAARGAWAAWAAAVSVNLVVWLLVSLGAGTLVYFWPAWVAGPWGAVLLSSTLAGTRSGVPVRPAPPAA